MAEPDNYDNGSGSWRHDRAPPGDTGVTYSIGHTSLGESSQV